MFDEEEPQKKREEDSDPELDLLHPPHQHIENQKRRQPPAMAPPVDLFPASELPQRVQIIQVGFKPKRRKGGPFDPFSCPLYELNQYKCEPDGKGSIHCHTIARLFRKYVRLCIFFGHFLVSSLLTRRRMDRCANGVTVETTALELEREEPARSDPSKHQGEVPVTTSTQAAARKSASHS
jgi:hypothetical protein